MFAKLLKYDMRSLKKQAVPILIALIALTVLASISGFFSVRYLVSTDNSAEINEFKSIIAFFVTMMLSLGSMFVMILFGAAATIMLVLVCVRFYKNTVSDEGYLTFTLPVKSNEIIFSKLVSGLIWTAVITIASVLGILVVLFSAVLGIEALTLSDLSEIFKGLWEIIMGVFEGLEFGIVLIVIQAIISVITSLAFELLLFYTAIFFASTITQKNKGLAAVGCVIGANTVMSIFSSIFSMVLMPLMITVDSASDAIASYNITLLVTILFYGGAAVGCYFLLKNMMDKRLNLS